MVAKIYVRSGNTYVTDATYEHVDELAPRLRQADLDEVWASHHLSGYHALKLSLGMSDPAFSIIHNDKVIAIFGAAPFTDGGASPWLLGSDEIRDIWLPFVRHSRYFVQLMLDRYGYLENYVDARNVLSIAWLKFCGFKFEPAATYGVERLPFHRFWMEKGG